MKLTVLIDLDDTLLGTNEDTFIPAYIRALALKVGRIAPDKFSKELLNATFGMIKKDTPVQTLEESFNGQFYPAIGIPRQEIIDTINQFYAQDFGKLQTITTSKPEARTLVETALSLGHQVVIATSPFFPKTATLQRLAWAGLSIEQYPFGLISTYEDFHFAKPNPAYYTEVLAQLGWTGDPAVMIGNHYEFDILPAEMLGFPTYLVSNIDSSQNQLGNPLSSSGTLAEAIPWLTSISNSDVKNDYSSVDAMLAVLKATPAAMETLSKDLKSEFWSKRTDSNEWAMNEIFCHMRDVDSEVNLPRIQRVMAEADAFVAGIDTDSWAEEMDYIHQNGSQAFANFLKTRVQILNHLSTLSDVDWQKQLRHAIFGPTTFKELINFIVTHDQNHLQQVKQTINRLKEQYPD